MKLWFVLLGVVVGGSAACAPRYELRYPVGTSGATEPMRPAAPEAVVTEEAPEVDPEREDADDEREAAAAPSYDQRYQPVRGLAMPFQGRVRGNTAAGGTAPGRTIEVGDRKLPAGAFNRDLPTREVPALPPPPVSDGASDGGDSGE